MENEIKVGEFVRMLNGLIAQIVTKDKDEHFILDRYYAGGTHLTEIEVKNDILKHSPNIIDLIEVGDVIKIQNKSDKFTFKVEIHDEKVLMDLELSLDEINILEIVTHEQFEQICYKVED